MTTAAGPSDNPPSPPDDLANGKQLYHKSIGLLRRLEPTVVLLFRHCGRVMDGGADGRQNNVRASSTLNKISNRQPVPRSAITRASSADENRLFPTARHFPHHTRIHSQRVACWARDRKQVSGLALGDRCYHHAVDMKGAPAARLHFHPQLAILSQAIKSGQTASPHWGV